MSVSIAFIHSGYSLLPELEVYKDFFSRQGIQVEVLTGQPSSAMSFDIEWYFMGTHFRRQSNALVIHEYLSASTQPFGGIKNKVKKILNCKPDYRIFFSEFVEKAFSFNDDIPYGYRGHGILSKQNHQVSEKRFDFIYIGSVAKERNIDLLLNMFAKGPLQYTSILILSKDYAALDQEYAAYNNIQFKGPVSYFQVSGYIAQAAYAINFIPDAYPYNRQVSSKLYDYSACNIPVITTDYQWVREFQNQFGGRFYFLSKDLSNFSIDEIKEFDFAPASVDTETWDKKIRNSGVLDFITQKTGYSFQAE